MDPLARRSMELFPPSAPPFSFLTKDRPGGRNYTLGPSVCQAASIIGLPSVRAWPTGQARALATVPRRLV
jgi:hypothetical protein